MLRTSREFLGGIIRLKSTAVKLSELPLTSSDFCVFKHKNCFTNANCTHTEGKCSSIKTEHKKITFDVHMECHYIINEATAVEARVRDLSRINH